MKAQGFSLAEFLISLALVCIVGWQGLQFLEEQKKQILYSHQDIEIQGIVQDIRRLLQDPASCRESLQGLRPEEAPKQIHQLIQITRIQNKLFKQERYPTFEKGQQTFGTGRVRLESYHLESNENSPGQIPSTALTIRFDRQHALPKEAQRYTQESIRLFYELGPDGFINDCSLNPRSRTQQYWHLVDGKNLNYSQGKVGVLTPNPLHSLHLQGRLQFAASSTPTPRRELPICQLNQLGTLWRHTHNHRLFYCDGTQWLQY